VLKERTLDGELGIRASLADGKLVVNANAYRADIWNFQQTIYQYDAYLSSIATMVSRSIPAARAMCAQVRTQGLEAQVSYSGIRNLDVRFSGAYTDARYVSYPTAPQPSENGDLAVKYRDLSGRTLPNAPRFQFNAAVPTAIRWATSINSTPVASVTYTSRQNGDSALSDYGWQHAYAITDLSLGVGRIDKRFDLNVIVRNLFNVTRGDAGWSSITIYQRPRWVGVSLSSKFL
jgi:outer membrane receptor protein involved in Fe transport